MHRCQAYHRLPYIPWPPPQSEDVDVLKKRLMDCALELKRRPPYFQFINIHRAHRRISQIALSKRLAAVAAALLQVDRVRLYQTGMFVKDPFGVNNPTNWHKDLNMVGSQRLPCVVRSERDRQGT